MKARELKMKYHQQHHKFSVKNLGAPCKENHWTLYKRLQYSKVIMEMTDTFWMRLQNWSIPDCILLKGCVQRLWWVCAVQTIFQNITFLKKMGGGGGERICKDSTLDAGSSIAVTVSFSVHPTWLISCDCRKITVQRFFHHKTSR